MKSSRDASAARSEALMWFGVAVMALSLVTYSLHSIYRGFDSLFTAQKAVPTGGRGFVFVALGGLVFLFVGLGWSSLINRRHVGRHEVPAADSRTPDETIAA